MCSAPCARLRELTPWHTQKQRATNGDQHEAIKRARPDLNQGPADLQSASLTNGYVPIGIAPHCENEPNRIQDNSGAHFVSSVLWMPFHTPALSFSSSIDGARSQINPACFVKGLDSIQTRFLFAVWVGHAR